MSNDDNQSTRASYGFHPAWMRLRRPVIPRLTINPIRLDKYALKPERRIDKALQAIDCLLYRLVVRAYHRHLDITAKAITKLQMRLRLIRRQSIGTRLEQWENDQRVRILRDDR